MNKHKLSEDQINSTIDIALAEDTGQGDVTSEALILPRLAGTASILAKARGILAGGEVARGVFLRTDSSLEVKILIEDGSRIKPGDVTATVSGRIISILKAERVALNFLQRLSGIATQTNRYVTRTRGLKAKITDTRKTTPGLRTLEKYAVGIGGGNNHRYNLGDGILIKDNHLAAMRSRGMNLRDIITTTREHAPGELKVEVEVSTIQEALEAAEARADIILLDNMTPDDMRCVVNSIPGDIKTEASGGITLANVRTVAIAGVDVISIGALTHSTKALDISLELEPATIRLV